MLTIEQVIDFAKQQNSGVDVVDANFDELFEFFVSPDRREYQMPYGVAKARTGDPFHWIEAQLDSFNSNGPIIVNWGANEEALVDYLDLMMSI